MSQKPLIHPAQHFRSVFQTSSKFEKILSVELGSAMMKACFLQREV
jgi:hypothetical protein